MNSIIKLFFALVLLSSLGLSYAFGADFFIWKTHPQGMGIIMAKKEKESPEQAISSYFKAIHETKSLSALLDQEEIQSLKIKGKLPIRKGVISSLPKATSKPRFIVVTNELR